MAVNTKTNRNLLYLTLTKRDCLSKLKELLPKEILTRMAAPWIYVQPLISARCHLYNRVFFESLSHIHSYCRNCYKVVVRPRTIVELFDLYELQREMGVPCKCGLERRDTVHGLYGGYFYNRGKEEGLERLAQVKEAVARIISPDIPIILKRYCTEYEIGPGSKGPSDAMPDVTPAEREWELEIESLFPNDPGRNSAVPIDLVNVHVMVHWIHYAYKHGDKTYSTFTDGNPLFPPYVTYSKENSNGSNS